GFTEKLRGAFSFVLWDRQKRQLIAAVDHFGVNRLVYYEDSKVFVIASRIDALVRAGNIPTDINPRAVANTLHFTNNLAPDTILAKVRRLTPATILTASPTGVRTAPYWDMRYGRGKDRNEERLSRKMEEVVQQAVTSCCKDDAFTGIGSYLSGGTDS